MNEQQFGNRIKQNLNEGLALDASILSKLKVAREAALQRQSVEATASVLAWAGNASPSLDGPRPLLSRVLLPALILALGLFAVNYWHQMQQAQETVDIDAAVLTGELPIDAYLDKGFDAWLKSSSD